MAHLPMTIIHDGSKCVEGRAVKVGRHVVELRHGEHIGVNVPVMVGLCGCCEPIGDVSDGGPNQAAQLNPTDAARDSNRKVHARPVE